MKFDQLSIQKCLSELSNSHPAITEYYKNKIQLVEFYTDASSKPLGS